jgi:DNA-binding transcriptional ArsR family regulator
MNPSSPEHKFLSSPDRLDRVFHALSDRTRREILRRLSRGPAIVSELAAPIPMSRMSVSKHLKVLERARLIVREVDGRVHRCSLATRPLQDAEKWLAHYRAFWTDNLEALARYAEHGVSKARLRARKGSRGHEQ